MFVKSVNTTYFAAKVALAALTAARALNNAWSAATWVYPTCVKLIENVCWTKTGVTVTLDDDPTTVTDTNPSAELPDWSATSQPKV